MSAVCECGCGEKVATRFVHGHNRRGFVRTAAERARIGASLRTTLASPTARAEKAAARIGSRNPQWRGDEVGYQGVHTWVRRHRARTGVCEHCGERPEPMRNGQAGTEFANISGEYRRDLDDYLELCRSCHIRFDREVAA